MKSTIVKAALLATAALALGAIATSASASTMKYTFTGYCDGVTLTTDGVTYGGTHTGCTNNDAAGGVAMKVKTNPTPYADIATTDSENAPGVVETFFLDLPAKTWYLYETIDGVFTDFNSGTLTKGAPKVEKVGLHSTASKPARRVNGPF
jgi:hypothetical protein